MKSLSVKFKLFSGFGVIVAALIGVAILSVNGLGVVRDLLVEYRGAARQSLNVNAASLAMMEARLSFMKYRASLDPAMVATLHASLDQNDEFARKLKEQLAGTDGGATLDGLMSKAAAYARGVDAYVDAQTKVAAAVDQYTALGTKLRQDLSARLPEVARTEGADTVLRLSQFQEAMLRGRTFMERYVASLKDADLAEARSIAAEGTRAIEAIGAVLKDTEHAAAIKALSDGYAAFVAQAETVAGLIARRIEARDTVDALGPELSSGYASLLDTIVGQQNTLGPQAQATAESTVTRTLVVSAVFALAGIAIALVLGFGLSRAITAITGSMRRLAGGDLDADIYGIGRRDEIGAMAGAVGVFKENAIERRRLEAEQEAAKAAAETEKRRMMAALADDFETAIGGIVSTVSASASQLQSSAQILASTSEETSRQSAAVAAASEEASVNVQTVATASEELAVSVAEVGKQVSDSARMSDNAVAEAAATADKVKQLSIAADRIGSIVDLIQTISGQTNLLALNATIEAARAGEAGRGFAVVAAEVKNLADQTAKATTEIAQHIAAIQSTTADSVAAIDGISTLIRNLNQIATAIAGAVEEQGAATQEIARNVQQAAQGTSSVSGSIVEVQQAATEASGASSQVLGAASGLAEQAGRLRQELGRFLANVRAG